MHSCSIDSHGDTIDITMPHMDSNYTIYAQRTETELWFCLSSGEVYRCRPGSHSLEDCDTSCYTNTSASNPKFLNFKLLIRLIYYTQFFSFCQESFSILQYRYHQVQNNQFRRKCGRHRLGLIKRYRSF